MRRREFLQGATLTATGILVPRVHTAEAGEDTTSDDSQVRVALIGAGTKGKLLLNAARQLPHLRFQAVCDIWDYARNVARQYLARYGHDVRDYVDYRELLDKESGLDAVLIATPDFAHVSQVEHALERGLHVYCEPLLGHTLEAARRVRDAARRSSTLLQVGFQRRADPRYQHVYRRLLREARLPGTITAFQSQWASPVEDLRGWPRRFEIDQRRLKQFGYADMNQFRNWLWYPQFSGGPYCNHVAHQLDVCQWMLGRSPRSVLASGGNDYYHDRQHWDTVMSVFEFPGSGDDGKTNLIRACCQLLTTSSGGGTRQFERFLGTDGSIQLSENPRWVRIGREPAAADWDQWVRRALLVKPEQQPAYAAPEDAVDVRVSGELETFQLPDIPVDPPCAAQLANFRAAISGQAELVCPGDIAWPSHLAVFQAIEAAQSRTVLMLDPPRGA